MVATACAALAGVLPSQPARAQTYPARPIRLIVPFSPGGGTDACARVIAEHLGRRLGQQVVVDNKPGASGNIGTQLAARAEPDGHTLLLAFDGTLAINPHVFEKISFSTARDFLPVGKIGDAALILVAHPGFAARRLAEVIALSKTEAGGLPYGTAGTGGTPHIAGELLRQVTGARLMHIPYKGGAQAMTDVMGGSIPLVFTAVAGAAPHVRAGKLHPIAVSSAQRTAALPEVPTFMESGLPEFEISSWVGLAAPARTPRPIIEKLNGELNAVLADRAVVDRLDGIGITAAPGTPESFGAQILRDLHRYGNVVKAAGIRLE
jgi:tripartite-type tricarboxylate transporter receptor subunit TctC